MERKVRSLELGARVAPGLGEINGRIDDDFA